MPEYRDAIPGEIDAVPGERDAMPTPGVYDTAPVITDPGRSDRGSQQPADAPYAPYVEPAFDVDDMRDADPAPEDS